jgi:hypothetical protein
MQFLSDVAAGCNSQIYFKLDTSPFTISTLMKSDELHWISPTPIWKKHSTIFFQIGYIAPTSLWTFYILQQWVFLSPDWLQSEKYYWLLCSNNVVCSFPIILITKPNVSHIHMVITLSHVNYNFFSLSYCSNVIVYEYPDYTHRCLT